jgi:hypothetical protein
MVSLWAFLLLAASTGGAANPPHHSRHQFGCEQALTPLSATEIKSLVSGGRITFAERDGVCPGSRWLEATWSIDFRADGTSTRRFHRVPPGEGRYFLRQAAAGRSRLCVASIMPMSRWLGSDNPASPYFSAWTDCFTLYRDARERLYLKGDNLAGDEPAMIQVQPIG